MEDVRQNVLIESFAPWRYKILIENRNRIFFHTNYRDPRTFELYSVMPRRCICPELIMTTYFEITDVFKEGGSWFLTVKFEDIAGEEKEARMARYDLASQTNVMSCLYMNGLPYCYNEKLLVEYLRSCRPFPKEEKKEEEKEEAEKKQNEQEQNKQN